MRRALRFTGMSPGSLLYGYFVIISEVELVRTDFRGFKLLPEELIMYMPFSFNRFKRVGTIA